MGAGSSTTVGTLRLAKTIEGAIASTDDVLVVGWEDDITATIPKTTAAAYAALTNLEQTAGNAVRWARARAPDAVTAPPGDATGETARFRVRYYVAGGGTADVRLVTGSSGSPYAVTGLTGAAWRGRRGPIADCRRTRLTRSPRSSSEAQTSAGTVYIRESTSSKRDGLRAAQYSSDTSTSSRVRPPDRTPCLAEPLSRVAASPSTTTETNPPPERRHHPSRFPAGGCGLVRHRRGEHGRRGHHAPHVPSGGHRCGAARRAPSLRPSRRGTWSHQLSGNAMTGFRSRVRPRRGTTIVTDLCGGSTREHRAERRSGSCHQW